MQREPRSRLTLGYRVTSELAQVFTNKNKNYSMHPCVPATNKTVSFYTSLLIVGVGVQSLPVTADAQEARERSSFTIGAFITDRRSTARLDSTQGPGTDIDLEEDLGMETSLTVARIDGYYWITPRQRLDLSLFDLSRTSTKQIDRMIDFGGEIFNVNTVVASEADLTILKAAYTFAVVDRERGFLGITAGLYVASTLLSLSEATLGTAKSEDLTAPLPVIGLRGEYEITDKISLRGAGEWFRIDTGGVSGSLNDIYVGVDYGFNERMAVGLAYNGVSMNIEASKTVGFEGTLDWGYDGFLLYFKFDF